VEGQVDRVGGQERGQCRRDNSKERKEEEDQITAPKWPILGVLAERAEPYAQVDHGVQEGRWDHQMAEEPVLWARRRWCRT
jgi:hypothetical protein